MRSLRVKPFAFLILLTAVLAAPGAMYGQSSDLVPASSNITDRYGATSYRLSEGEDGSVLVEALTAKGETVFSARWAGTPSSDDVSVTVLKDDKSLGITCSQGSSDCLAFEDSKPTEVQDLSEVSRGLSTELNDYLGDIFGFAALANGCATEQPGLRLAAAASSLTTKQRRAIAAVCSAAVVCSAFWPFGTLICGPTAVGCAVYYAVS